MKALTLPKNGLLAPGPARLIENLEGVFDSDAEPAVALLLIDRQQRVTSLLVGDVHQFSEQVACHLDGLDESEGARAVLLRRFTHRIPTEEIRAECQTWSQHLADRMNIIVDILLVGPHFWWSALCEDDGCCPPFGRSRAPEKLQITGRQRRLLWKHWKAFAGVDETYASPNDDDIAEMIFWLSDVRLRDSVLAHAGQNPESRERWLTAVQKLRCHPVFAHDTPLGAVECSLHYLSGDLKQARLVAQQVLKRDGSYSLAQLLHKGLAANAPAQLLEAAFCNASIDFMIGDDEPDGPEQAA